ncbi:unnamed protein product, partial [Strongylus vulgaris]
PADRKKFSSDINSNIAKDHTNIKKFADKEAYRKQADLPRRRAPSPPSETVHATLVHVGEGVEEKAYSGGKINRELDLKHQIIYSDDEKQQFSTQENRAVENFYNAKPIPSPTFQRLQHQYTPEDVRITKNDRSDEKQRFFTEEGRSLLESYRNVKSISSPSLQRIQYQYAPEDVKSGFYADGHRKSVESYHNAKPIPSPTFQRLQHIYTPEDVKTSRNDSDDNARWESSKSVDKGRLKLVMN